MAQLRSYFSLCGISGEGPLGVECDVDDQALITLSRNVVMRYRLSDQKQIGGWNSKEFITAPVVYDTGERSYVGVFGEDKIKVWKEEEQNVDGVKKTKLRRPIFKLICDKNGKVVVVFKDGSCASLAYCTYARKNLEKASFLEKEVIVDAMTYEDNGVEYISFITKSDDNNDYNIINCQLNLEICTVSEESVKRICIRREDFSDAKVMGITLCRNAEGPKAFVIWSDGRLCSLDLLHFDVSQIGHVPWLHCATPSSLVWIGENHLALYGADAAQEGAVLVIFNVLFGVAACRYPMKMFRRGARAWCLPEHLLLEANQQLAVVPYALSTHRSVLSLLGSSKKEEASSEIADADWGRGRIEWGGATAKTKWSREARTGAPERDISAQYLLALLEGDDSNDEEIRKALGEFSDVSERSIVSLVTYAVKKFRAESKEGDDYAEFMQNSRLRSLLNAILDLPFVSTNIVPYLRVDFDLDDSVVLLRYLNFMLTDCSAETNFSAEYEEKLVKWASVMIDSHFHQFAISKNRKNLEVIFALKTTLDDLIQGINHVESVLPEFHSLCYENNDNEKNEINDSALYYIEEIKLF